MTTRCHFALLLAILAASPCAADDDYPTAAAPFVNRYCLPCHGAQKQEGGVRFDGIDGVTGGNRNLWTQVHRKIAAGEMPPAGRPQPSANEKAAFQSWIAARQRALGIGGTRRLNRRELAASLRYVTGHRIDYSLGLPGDGTVGGFDTGADGLPEAADSVAQWLLVTRRAVDGLRFLDAPFAQSFAADLRLTKDPRKAIDDWKLRGASGKGSGIARPGLGLLIEPRAVGDREEFAVSVPVPPDQEGVLRVSLVVSVMKPLEAIPNPRLWVRIGGQDMDFREITGTPDRPQRLVYEAQIGDLIVQPKGVTVSLSNKVEVPYAVPGFENEDKSNPKEPVPGGTGLFRPAFDRKALPPEQQPAPYLVLHDIAIDVNAATAWPPPEWNVKVGSLGDDANSARRLLHLWMERAWRRPVAASDAAPFFALYEQLRTRGMSFDAALRPAFQSVLMSAPFRYHTSPALSDAAAAQFALAGRLSFMFWGEPPDAELHQLAAAGKLNDPAVRDAQVDRLLADPRSIGFVKPFAMQWLELEQPITIAQTHLQKQDFRFARHLKASMREETIAYIGRLVAENRPAAELIVSDWTMMNDILALHYGYDGIAGGTLRPVTLRPDDPRGGGILGHAGIQSMLCWMGDNWVIYRGAWTLRHILDLPPPPPPLEVPELNPSDGKNKGKPFRELLKQHQDDGRCAVCHKTIDPVGFAFQNFDLSGRWRDVEHESYQRGELDGRIAWLGVGKTRPVDAVGRLPRGEEFRSFAEFKRLVVAHYRDDLVRGLLKNFTIYATGQLPGIDQLAEIEAIMANQRERGYPLRDLLKAVVRMKAFQQ